MAIEIRQHLKNAKDEKRLLIKQIIGNNTDLIPDEQTKTFTVVLHTLSTPRFNEPAKKLAELLNQTETVFPGTEWMMKFKTSTVLDCES